MTMKVRYTSISGQILAVCRGASRTEFVPDLVGSVIAMVDNTQSVSDTFSYWPYGEIRVRTGDNPSRLQFRGTSGYYALGGNGEAKLGGVFLTDTGRWTSRSLGGPGDEGNTLALPSVAYLDQSIGFVYAYAGGDPVSISSDSARTNTKAKTKWPLKCLSRRTPNPPKGNLSDCQIECLTIGVNCGSEVERIYNKCRANANSKPRFDWCDRYRRLLRDRNDALTDKCMDACPKSPLYTCGVLETAS